MIDEMGDRIKERFEDAYRVYLPSSTYLLLRIDGKAFHTYTKKAIKPYDHNLAEAFDTAAKVLCRGLMGCRFAYGQSDEYSFLATDFERPESEMWFSGNLQKITSVAASIFTAAFNRARLRQLWQRYGKAAMDDDPETRNPEILKEVEQMTTACFDARAFIISRRLDVADYFTWRQTDASRNSLNSLAAYHYSHKELQGASSSDRHDMLHSKGIEWTDQPIDVRRGRVLRKQSRERDVVYVHKGTGQITTQLVQETYWDVDRRIPVFSNEPGYLESLIP